MARHIHVEQPDHTVKMNSMSDLTTETRWFKRGVKEAIYIKAMHPNLNRDGGRYSLPPVWDNIITKNVKTERMREGGGDILLTGVKHNVLRNIMRTSYILMKLVVTNESSICK